MIIIKINTISYGKNIINYKFFFVYNDMINQITQSIYVRQKKKNNYAKLELNY